MGLGIVAGAAWFGIRLPPWLTLPDEDARDIEARFAEAVAGIPTPDGQVDVELLAGVEFLASEASLALDVGCVLHAGAGA